MKVFSGSSNKPLSEKIAKLLQLSLSPVEMHTFPDGERRVRMEESVVEEDVIIIQTTSTPVDHNYMELFFLIDSAKRNGAASITAVIPYLGYQRQDHIFRSGEAVSLDVVIKIIESLGTTGVIIGEPHSIKIPELFHIPVSVVSAIPLFAKVIKENGWSREDSCLVSPDMGGQRRVKQLSSLLGQMQYVVTVKDRDLASGVIEMSKIEGDRENIKKRAIIVDDMISSGKTIVKSAELLLANGAGEVVVFAVHPVFSEDAPELLQSSSITKVYVTDSVYVPKEKQFEKLEILSISSMIAETLRNP